MIFADTSALFATVYAEDEAHSAAESAFSTLIGTGLIIHNYVVVELVALVQARVGADAARRILQDLVPALDVRWIDRHVHDAAVAAFIASSPRDVSFVDHVSFELMRRERIDTAFAFDRDFADAGFAVVP